MKVRVLTVYPVCMNLCVPGAGWNGGELLHTVYTVFSAYIQCIYPVCMYQAAHGDHGELLRVAHKLVQVQNDKLVLVL